MKLTRMQNRLDLCKIAVPDLEKIEETIKEGKCSDICMDNVRLYMDHEKQGSLCPKAKKILHRILKRYGGSAKHVGILKHGGKARLKF